MAKPVIQGIFQNRALQLAILIAVLCIGLQALGLDQLLRFDRHALLAGNWWLLLTGNFVHLNWNHLMLNMAGLALIVMLVWSNFTAWEWTAVVLFSSLGVGVGLFLLDTQIEWYVGFSGTLHGLLLAGALADLRRYPINAGFLIVAVCLKLLWEQIYGAVPGSESVAGGAVVVNSHLYGAICGAVIALPLLAISSRRKQQGQNI